MTQEKDAFDDPLKEIDPVMEEAYSPVNDKPDTSSGEDVFLEGGAQPDVAHVEFPEVNQSFQGKPVEAGLFSNIPVTVSVELGRSAISLKEIFELAEGSIVELDRLVGEPLDLVVNKQVVAQGEVVAIDNNFGLRVKTIVSKPHAL